ncbi:MAG: DEAD/DEAH box helicase family protein [Deltaproteobacteria bacterium]|nr:DEAD/DEAH box helicase family protein [Deltaproteobacteria bacterium]
MVFDFSKIKAKRKEIGPIDPIELFQKLKVTDQNINDLWLAQGDALREWHQNRDANDIGVVLNTGAGKTLVGLLIAQSLVNETKGSVLYACSSIQLVEQTTEKAKGYGFDVTTYYRGEYNNDLFRKGEAPCITTYQALFNGKSVFFREEIDAVVFDDAHAAEHLIRDHFSLQLEKNAFPEIFSEIFALFKEYHKKVGRTGSYEEMENASIQHLFLIPPFEIQRQYGELMRILGAAKLSESKETTFAWEYLRDHIDLCCILMTGSIITITPPFIPVGTLPYFARRVRRVYMSATLSASDAFARTFGCVPDKVITPTTTAGECERLIIIPAQSAKDSEDIDTAKMLIDTRKGLILVPTYSRALKWQDVTRTPRRSDVSMHVQEFKKDTGTPKLLLAARYDGMDLPGDTCRVMIIDDLPMGVGPLERFLWEHLNLSNTLRSAIASRIVQSFGRISRGMSDHGVVILTGKRLVEWLATSRNVATLPAFLQRQIALGLEISKNAKSIDELFDAINQCLSREEGWLSAYSDFMQNNETEVWEGETEILAELAQLESEYACHMWHRKYDEAAKCLRDSLENAFGVSTSTGAWHALWLGRAFELMGDSTSAIDLYKRSHSSQYNIPAYPSDADGGTTAPTQTQIIEVYRQFEENPDGKIYPPKRLNQDLAHLDGSGSAAQTEESLRALGQYLGLKTSRPDKEHGTGPDVLWELDTFPTLCLEVKTNKHESSKYKKEEIGQLNDHVQWVRDNTDSEDIIASFVGPIICSTPAANPPEYFRVIALEQFNALAKRLISALSDAANSALPITLHSVVLDIFNSRNLLWPGCLDHMESKYLRDL